MSARPDSSPAVALHGLRPTLALLCLCAALIPAYWLSYFGDEAVRASGASCYHIFERNFPLPDGFVALCALLAAVQLSRRRASGLFWALLCAGGLCFLGLIDISYNLWNRMYADLSAPMLVEVLINLACLSLAAWLVQRCWRWRRLLVQD